ncbi:transcription elongation factor GreAB [Pseudoalteromonas fenneropenaei]|uniref:Transcription elongation factor GreAB n=1 Tax=Pseudoalteromonas fenneropenaei TaxID=1737459 RepID=A0ABV7CF95_9GAMM
MTTALIRKHIVEAQLQFALEANIIAAKQAAASAREDAVHEQSVAETQYDSLAIESAYLAHGHSERCDAASRHLSEFNALFGKPCQTIQPGALFALVNEQDERHYYYLGPHEGGLKVFVAGTAVVVITLASPLGMRLQGLMADDEVVFEHAGRSQTLTVEFVC